MYGRCVLIVYAMVTNIQYVHVCMATMVDQEVFLAWATCQVSILQLCFTYMYITGTCLDAYQKANGLEILHSTALQAHAG